MREIKWTTEHTLTAEQLDKLIRQKVERVQKQMAVQKGLAKKELRT